MKPLRELADRDVGDDRLVRRGVDLLRRTPPAPPMPDAQLRVWRAIQDAAGRPAAWGRGLAMKLAAVGAVALVAGTAGAVVGGRWVSRARPTPPPPVAPSPAPRSERAGPPPPADVTPLAPPAESGTPKAPPRAPAKRPPPTPGPSAASLTRERSEVLDALVALRREHDPARASALLARYLSAHPRGALREEALVLAIEAADAGGDRDAARKLADAYRRDYPTGRFASFARSHGTGAGAGGSAPGQ